MRCDHLTRAAVALGLGLRLWHYAADRTVWYDEAVLLANVLTKTWAGLLGPLDHAVAAPPLYLWLLKLVAATCGDVQLCWRAVPLACSCGHLLATVPLCRRVLPPAVVPAAVAVTALADNNVWHAVTVKPYSGDALLCTLLLLGLVRTEYRPAGARLVLLAAVAPVALCLSYPMAFVLGGLLVALLPAAWRGRSLVAWSVAAASVAGTFGVLLAGPIRTQKVPGLVAEHAAYYPSAGHPLGPAGWLVQHTAEVFQYTAPVGGFGLFALAPLGAVAAWRAGRRELVLASAVPFPLVMLAAGLHTYPYGNIRLMLFIAPCCLLLGGLGLGAVWARSPAWGRAAAVTVVLLTTGPVGWHLYSPYPRPDSSGVARHIRALRRPGDLVASDEGCYQYFFRGELLTLDDARPLDGRLWVPMDHYDPVRRRGYVAGLKLGGTGWTLAGEWEFRGASAFLLVRPARP